MWYLDYNIRSTTFCRQKEGAGAPGATLQGGLGSAPGDLREEDREEQGGYPSPRMETSAP